MNRNLGILCFYQRLDCLLQSLRPVTSAIELTIKSGVVSGIPKYNYRPKLPEQKIKVLFAAV